VKLIARYLKPFWAILLLCLVLLFGQATCDLSLPNLMSDMVNVGIQQGGIEAGAPTALRKEGLDLLCAFADDQDKLRLESGYYTIEPGSSEAQRIAEEYPLAREESVCLLRDEASQEDLDALNQAYSRACYTMLLYLEQHGEDLGQAAAMAGMGAQGQMSGTMDGTDPYAQYQTDGSMDGTDPYGSQYQTDGSMDGTDPYGSQYQTDGSMDGTDPYGSQYQTDGSMDGGASYTAGNDTGDEMGGTVQMAPAQTYGTEGVAQYTGGANSVAVQAMTYTPEADASVGVAESYDLQQPVAGTGEDSVQDPSYEGEGQSVTDPDLYNTQEPTYTDGETQDSGETAEDSAGEDSQDSSGLNMSGGLDSVSLEKLYQLTPLLSYVPQEGLEDARQQAAQGSSMMGDQVGVALVKLFYEELGMDTAAIQTRYIWGKGLQMLGVALLGVIATVLVGFFSARMAATVGKRLRHDLFSKVESFSSGELDHFSTASLITRTTNDVQQIQMLITMGVRMICYAPIIGIGGVIFAVGKSLSLSWLIAVAVVVFLGLVMVALAVAMPRFKILQKLIDRLNLVSRENLSGMLVVRAFGNETFEEQRFDKANRDLMETNRFVQRVMSVLMPAMMLGMNLLSVMIVWVGGHAIADSTLQIGDMMAFIQYAMQIIMAFLMIAMMFVFVPRASVSAGRIREVLDAPLSITDPEKPQELADPKGLVEFHDVSFRYGGADSDVLEHISFTAKPGETTAFIGATGSGKSTLVNLIPRFYDVTGGSITIDGVDVRQLSQHRLRELIGYVPQKGLLFSGTVASNLRYGKEDASDEDLHKALETAQAADFVDELELGVEAHISQGGTNVSGGQRQRLSIARALTKKAPIYIFDDSFSALDFKTDAALRKALAKDTAGATVLLVAQRVSTILHAQQIIVLDEGKMVGKGTHKELLRTCPQYREIAESQLQKEELE
jgi:ATP-binding cassette subfamily B multidrug efflux pump